MQVGQKDTLWQLGPKMARLLIWRAMKCHAWRARCGVMSNSKRTLSRPGDGAGSAIWIAISADRRRNAPVGSFSTTAAEFSCLRAVFLAQAGLLWESARVTAVRFPSVGMVHSPSVRQPSAAAGIGSWRVLSAGGSRSPRRRWAIRRINGGHSFDEPGQHFGGSTCSYSRYVASICSCPPSARPQRTWPADAMYAAPPNGERQSG